MSHRLLPSIGVLAVALLAAMPAGGEEGGTGEEALDRAGFAEVRRAIDADPSFAAVHEACPADVFETERAFWQSLVRERRVRLAACEKDAMDCYRRCVQARSGPACFSLARALQENEPRDTGGYWEKLFARACAVGNVAGCTNRGAGIRNGYYDGDPFRDVDDLARDRCLFRTFELACGREDAWGCAMHGQSHHRGEGTARDPELAARHYRKSCEINPDFDACRFSRSRLAEIDGRPLVEDDGSIEH